MPIGKITLLLIVIVQMFSVKLLSAPRADSLPHWALGPFLRPANVNPVLSAGNAVFFDPISRKNILWESNDVFNPAAVSRNGKVYVLYRAEDKSGSGIGGRTSRIGMAESADGFKLQKQASPVLFPQIDGQEANEWPGGCEDPRVAETPDGRFIMLYTQWNRLVPRLAVAISNDLYHWKKYGPVFQNAYQGLFRNIPSKSASILTELKNGKLLVTKVNNQYWMYWGEQNVYAARSEDLINWVPLIETDSSLKKLLSPRKYYFDSELTECGPPAVKTRDGILLMYNGKNAGDSTADIHYTKNSYCAGQVLFDKDDPSRVLERLNQAFLTPESSFEKSGQYPAGTVFIEGLVYQKKKWLLYYGCADSKVAVAVFEPGKSMNQP